MKNHGGDGQFWKIMLCLLPAILALQISAFDTRDYIANFSDINMGTFLGISCGAIGYFLNYPSLFSALSGLPVKRNFDFDEATLDVQMEEFSQ